MLKTEGQHVPELGPPLSDIQPPATYLTRYHITTCIIILLLVSGALILITSLATMEYSTIIVALSGFVIDIILLLAHLRRWRWSAAATTATVLLLTILSVDADTLKHTTTFVIFLPTIIAATLHSPPWAIAAFASTMSGIAFSVYLQTGTLAGSLGPTYRPLTIIFAGIVAGGVALVSAVARAATRRAERQADVLVEQKATLVQQASALAFSGAIIESSYDAIIGITLDGTILSWNPGAKHLYGIAKAEAIGQSITQRIAPIHRQHVLEIMERVRHGERTELIEMSHCRNDGTLIPIVMTCSPIYDSSTSTISGIAVIVRDISERKRREEELIWHTFYDDLTGLPNRTMFREAVQRAITQAEWRASYQFAVLSLNFDRFKRINESLGPALGDQLLCAIARRLRDTLRRLGDTVARISGDEFAILLDDISAPEDVHHTVDRLMLEVAVPFVVDGREIAMTCCIGSAVGTSTDTPEDVMHRANSALNQAKARGNACYEAFCSATPTPNPARLQLEVDLRRALQRNEFSLHYQPIVSLTTNRIVKVEALIRWLHPERGLVPPSEFIPLAEEMDIIHEIGTWTLRTACAQVKAWQDAGLERIAVAVNLSARQFRHSDIEDLVDQVLSETGLPPECLELELTESSVMEDIEEVNATLHSLRALGVKIAIDDFGTGFSCLSYLREFPINTLKMDRAFVWGIATDTRGAALATSIINLGHSLNLQVVAEAVETPEQLSFLRDQGCDHLQGYLYSKPLPPEELARLLRERRRTESYPICEVSARC